MFLQQNLQNILQAPVQQDNKVLWLIWAMSCLFIVAVLSVTSLVILPLSIIGYTLFVVLVLCKGLGGACSAFGVTILMFFKNREGTQVTPSWSTMAERITTTVGLLGLLMGGRAVALACVALCSLFMYINQRAQLRKEECRYPEVDLKMKDLKLDLGGINGDLIPTELIIHIFSFLTAPELGNVSKVCWYWNRLSQEGSLWKSLYEQLDSKPFANKLAFTDWKQRYQANCLCPASVSKHNKQGDAWIIIGRKVYDITNFMNLHPGGEVLLLQFAGKDATIAFKDVNHTDTALKYRKDLEVGTLQWGGPAKKGQTISKHGTSSGSTLSSMCFMLDTIKPFTILVAFAGLSLCEYANL